MKTIILTLVALTFATVGATAKTNFGELIVENSKAQNELHSQIKSTVKAVNVAKREAIDGDKTVSIASETYHVKTNKNFLTFEKEKKFYKESESQAHKRLAEEFQNLE